VAVFAVTHVAEVDHPNPCHGREIAKALGVSADSLLKILQQLAKAGVLHSSRGRFGGFTLGRPSGEISLLAVVEAIDGPIDGRVPKAGLRGPARTRNGIEVAMGESARAVRVLLEQTTIRDLLESPESP
jgi:Rrf2 family protein